MVQLIRTTSANPDFVSLVKQLDAYLAIKDGDEHGFYDQFNKITHLKYVVVAYTDNLPVGCGALKVHTMGAMEIKRMYVDPKHRGTGIASQLLKTLEQWSLELGIDRCILETGKRQEEAVQLYFKNNYKIISNYEPYVGVSNSVCFEKKLTHSNEN